MSKGPSLANRKSTTRSENLKGNTNRTALKEPEIRQQAYDEYCKWLEKGKSSRSFTFEHELYTCTGQTLEAYIKNNPTEFPAIKREIAMNKGLNRWESVVEDAADGKNKEASIPGLQMLMRNKYGWDKEEKKKEGADEQVSALLAELLKRKNI